VRRIVGWKAIAEYFQRDPSTVRRWAADGGLPVYRPGGDGRRGASVYAYAHELDDWLKKHAAEERKGGGSDSAQPAASQGGLQQAEGVNRIGRPVLQAALWGVLALSLAALVGYVTLFASGSSDRNERGMAHSSEALPGNANVLYSQASYLWPKRTRETLLEAEKLLNTVTELAPSFADAYADLATVYNLMVEYHVKPAEEGYQLSLDAARQAIEIDPQHGSALTVLGDLSYYWQKKYDTAFEYFRRAVEAEPENAQARQWYASALMTSDRLDEAEVQIRKAREIKPESRSIIVSHSMIQLAQGDAPGARAALLQLLQNETNYRNPYRFLLFAELAERDMPAYIATLHDWFELIESAPGKVVAEAADSGWRKGGEPQMIKAMAEAANRQDIRDTLEQYFRAHVLALAGD
tara:strand:+ start:4379 stop:5605 length:1227 start_codon:yes stop_codon:yes gene_type:complete